MESTPLGWENAHVVLDRPGRSNLPFVDRYSRPYTRLRHLVLRYRETWCRNCDDSGQVQVDQDEPHASFQRDGKSKSYVHATFMTSTLLFYSFLSEPPLNFCGHFRPKIVHKSRTSVCIPKEAANASLLTDLDQRINFENLYYVLVTVLETDLDAHTELLKHNLTKFHFSQSLLLVSCFERISISSSKIYLKSKFFWYVHVIHIRKIHTSSFPFPKNLLNTKKEWV